MFCGLAQSAKFTVWLALQSFKQNVIYQLVLIN